MRQDWRDKFPLDPAITMFNHASYGLATCDALDQAESIRRQLERDPNVNLGEPLQQRLDAVLKEFCAYLGLEPELTALTTSATAGAAATQQSVPLHPGDVVMVLDCEYSSVLRGWQRRCAEVGAELRTVPVDLPLTSADDLLARMSATAEQVTILQFSAITSSAAISLPVARLAAWGRARGATVAVDAAHVPGQVGVLDWNDVDIVFGTVHKWVPVPRSVGVLWTSPQYASTIRPAEVSLTWDADSLARRFGWPGTFDPAARLSLPRALQQHADWAGAGELQRAEALADLASQALHEVGAVPTAGAGLLPPRMRAFLLPAVGLAQLRAGITESGIRAWTGSSAAGTTLLRLATHVYTDEDDIDRLRGVVESLLDSARSGSG